MQANTPFLALQTEYARNILSLDTTNALYFGGIKGGVGVGEIFY